MHALAVLLLLAPPGPPDLCKSDLAAAYEALEKECGRLLEAKGVSLGRIRKELAKDALAVKTTEDEWVVLVRLVARLRDGHAGVMTTERTKDLRWPAGPAARAAGFARATRGRYPRTAPSATTAHSTSPHTNASGIE